MNIAFPTFLLFLIILPGFICRLSFSISENTVIDNTPFATASVKGLVVAAGLHLVWTEIATVVGHPIDYNALLMLLASSQRENALIPAISNAANNFNRILFYFASLYTFAWSLGTILRYLVVWFKLDRKKIIGPLVKFDTPWYYLFTGYNEEFVVDGVVVSAVVEIEKIGYIYTGLLSEFFLNRDGTLDRLVLEMAMRRPVSNDKEPVQTNSSAEAVSDEKYERYYKIDGDYFILRYCEIKTLNIEFLRVEKSPIEIPAL